MKAEKVRKGVAPQGAKGSGAARGAGRPKGKGVPAGEADYAGEPHGSLEGPLCAPGLDRLVLQGDFRTGIVLISPGEVAVIRLEHAGRLEIVSSRGERFHLSRPLDMVAQALQERCPGFVKVSATALVNKKHVRSSRKVAERRWELELAGGIVEVMEPADALA